MTPTQKGQATEEAEPYNPDDPTDPFADEWEEKSLDGGEKIEWERGVPIEGAFIAKRYVTMDGEKDPTLQLIFEVKGLGRMFTWAGPKLSEAFEHVTEGSYVRVTWTDDKNVGRPSPMKVFSVQVRKSPATSAERNPKGPGTAGTTEEPF
jgi:hypothetical protein